MCPAGTADDWGYMPTKKSGVLGSSPELHHGLARALSHVMLSFIQLKKRAMSDSGTNVDVQHSLRRAITWRPRAAHVVFMDLISSRGYFICGHDSCALGKAFRSSHSLGVRKPWEQRTPDKLSTWIAWFSSRTETL
jgi:hypothetical protein